MARPIDKIHIRDLVVTCRVGTRAEERRRRRRVILNITLFCDLRAAGATDNLRDTVDYGRVCRQVQTLVRRSRFLLIERLAQAVADVCLTFAGVSAVTVALDKPGAVSGARSVAVEITRRRTLP